MRFADQDILRYSRNILLGEVGPAGQEKLFASSVLVVGAGGLGSPALFYLAAAGIGRIGIVDGDRVDLSNLNRQTIHRESSVGRAKADSARETLIAFRSDLEAEARPEALTPANALEMFRGYDVVVDGTDNFPAKYLCSDASVLTGIPLVHAGALRFGGQLLPVIPGKGPCLRCLLPEIPPRKDAPACAESGILGAVAGVIGAWQAVECVKILLGIGAVSPGRLTMFDTLNGTVSTLAVSRDPRCPACGASPRIRAPLSDAEYSLERSCAL